MKKNCFCLLNVNYHFPQIKTKNVSKYHLIRLILIINIANNEECISCEEETLTIYFHYWHSRDFNLIIVANLNT